MASQIKLLILLVIAFVLNGCSQTLPKYTHNNICEIYEYSDTWYDASFDSYERWGTPPHVLLAIVHQESRFIEDAQPPRKYLLGIIPWSRPSSAYGFAQALDGTWEEYKRETKRWRASRENVHDALDFIGWYNHRSHRMLGISKFNAYKMYLAYHEGQGGYKRGTYKRKRWLMNVAKKVSQRAERYHRQLKQCNR